MRSMLRVVAANVMNWWAAVSFVPITIPAYPASNHTFLIRTAPAQNVQFSYRTVPHAHLSTNVSNANLPMLLILTSLALSAHLLSKTASFALIELLANSAKAHSHSTPPTHAVSVRNLSQDASTVPHEIDALSATTTTPLILKASGAFVLS